MGIGMFSGTKIENFKIGLRYSNFNRNLFSLDHREELYWFFREQFRFGHREILLDYLEKTYDNLIVGFLQHGAMPTSNPGEWTIRRTPNSLRSYFPSFVWSATAAEQALKKGYSHVVAIGSPWLYLLELNGFLKPFSQAPVASNLIERDLLIVPHHGSGHYRYLETYDQSVRNLRESVSDREASVLLYYTEFCDPRIREIWEKFNFKVLSNGMAWGPENRTVWSYNGGRPQFLNNTLQTILKFDEVICMAPTTFSIYSTSLGRKTSIQISEANLRDYRVVNEGKGVDRLRKVDEMQMQNAINFLGDDAFIPEITERKKQTAWSYLGIDSMKSKVELESILPLREGMIPV